MSRAVLIALVLALAPATAFAAPPDIASPEAIVVEPISGEVIYEKDADTRRPIASTTKLMTALLTLEHGGLADTVTAPRYRAAPAEVVLGLVKGEQMTEADVLRGLLIISANDGAVALAVHVAGSVPAFVKRMNERAQQLGLTNTHYENPIGLDAPGNYSTARDLATLTRVLRKKRFFRRTVNRETATLASGSHPRTLSNRNTLLFDHPWVDGVKTGFTSQAGNVLVASGEKRRVHMLSVVIGASSKAARNDQSVRLLNYGLSMYRRVRAKAIAGERWASIPIKNRPGAELPVTPARTVRRVIRKGDELKYRTELPDHVSGPIRFGDRIGKLVVLLHDKPIATVPLTAALKVPKASAARRTQDFLTTPWTLVVVGVILIAAALLTKGRPRQRTRPTEA